MKFKRFLSGVLAAAVALSTMALTPFVTASADDAETLTLNASNKLGGSGTTKFEVPINGAGQYSVKLDFSSHASGYNSALPDMGYFTYSGPNPSYKIDIDSIVFESSGTKTEYKPIVDNFKDRIPSTDGTITEESRLPYKGLLSSQTIVAADINNPNSTTTCLKAMPAGIFPYVNGNFISEGTFTYNFTVKSTAEPAETLTLNASNKLGGSGTTKFEVPINGAGQYSVKLDFSSHASGYNSALPDMGYFTYSGPNPSYKIDIDSIVFESSGTKTEYKPIVDNFKDRIPSTDGTITEESRLPYKGLLSSQTIVAADINNPNSTTTCLKAMPAGIFPYVNGNFISEGTFTYNFTVKSTAEPKTGKCGENVTWSLDESTGVLTISGTGPMNETTYISCEGWEYCKYADLIKEVVIEEGVTSVGCSAFGTKGEYEIINGFPNLTKITLPSTIEKIGRQAFYCSLAENLTIPKNVKYIGQNAFNRSSIKSVTLSDGMELGGQAFGSCASLKEVTVGKDITYRNTGAGNASRENNAFGSFPFFFGIYTRLAGFGL